MSSNVFITVPSCSINDISCYSKSGKPGSPGAGGRAGKAGKCGNSGKGINEPFTEVADDIAAGNPGRTGRRGRGMPAAKIYINGAWVNREELVSIQDI
jgi:hypothetical protein